MGNSLNNAFARAYAKDQQLGRPSENVTLNNSADAKVPANTNPQPTSPSIQRNPPMPLVAKTSFARATTAQPSNAQPSNPQLKNQPSTLGVEKTNAEFTGTVAGSTASAPTAAPSANTRGPYPSSSASVIVHQWQAASTDVSARDLEQVEGLRRRFDEAVGSLPPVPHLAPRPRETASIAATTKSNNLTRRMQIMQPAAIPTEPNHTLAPSLPLADELPSQSSQDIDARRKQVEDYLFRAGQEPYSSRQSSVLQGTAQTNLELDRLMSSSIVDAWNGANSSTAPSEVHIHRPSPGEAPVASRSPMPSVGVVASAQGTVPVQPMLYQPESPAGSLPYNTPPREAPPVGIPVDHSRTLHAPLPAPTRPGEFLRVDIPVRQTKKSDSVYTYPEQPASAPVTQEPQRSVPSKPPQAQERILEPAHDISEAVAQAEEKLRQAKTRVFNPVWEVDELQWPEVCLQLMQKRAANLADIAKHLKSACQDGLQVLAVTSVQSGEGGSTVANCLAMLCAQHGMKIVLIDGNFDAPSLCAQTNLEIDNDWRAAIIEQMPLEEVAVHSIADQLTLVPLHKPEQPDHLLPSDQRIADMIRELAESFDLVIVDVGSVVSKASLITNLARQTLFDAAMIVVDRRRSDQPTIDNAVTRIRHAGVTSIGIIENFAA